MNRIRKLFGLVLVTALIGAFTILPEAKAQQARVTWETNYTVTVLALSNVVSSAVTIPVRSTLDRLYVYVEASANDDVAWKLGPTLTSNEVAGLGGYIKAGTTGIIHLGNGYNQAISMRCPTNPAAITGIKIKEVGN